MVSFLIHKIVFMKAFEQAIMLKLQINVSGFVNPKGVLSLGQFDIVYIDIVDMHEVCLMMHRYAMIQLTACCFYLAVVMSLASLFIFIYELSILKQ